MSARALAASLLLLIASFVTPVFAADRPNILWLITEDMGPELGCYGTPQVDTPNLDQLAAEGVRYTQAFTTAGVCSVSRSSFMTGMYSTTIGAQNHRSHRNDNFPLPDGVRVMTDWLRDAGYYTANLVKFPIEGVRGTGKTDWNFTYKGKPFDTADYNDLKSHQPFYAQVNFHESHRPYSAPPHADPDKVKMPPYYPDHPFARADWAAYLDEITQVDKHIGKIIDQLKADGLYDNTVILMIGDHGRSMLRGKQWCYDSGLSIPLIIRWPKNFPAPKQIAPGKVDDRLVSAIDLTATTLDIAGVAIPPKMEGQVFLGEHAAPDHQYLFGSRDRDDETVFHIRTVRDPQFRYIRNFDAEKPFLLINRYKEFSYPMITLMRYLDAQGRLEGPPKVLLAPHRPEEELYDLKADPYEIHNLAEDPQYKDTLDRLRKALTDWIAATGDKGQTPEDPAVVKKVEAEMIRAYETGKRSIKAQQAHYLDQIKKLESPAP